MADQNSIGSITDNLLNSESFIDSGIITAYQTLTALNPNHDLLHRLKKVTEQGFELTNLFNADYGRYRLNKRQNQGWMNENSLKHYLNHLNAAIDRQLEL